jgi:ADP-heptose:LPS heptosyltransferase
VALAGAARGETVLVLRALGLGDLLTAVPALRGLRRARPDAEIVLATPQRYAELAMHTGAIDAVEPTAGLGALAPRPTPPALAVNLHGSGPESIRDLVALQPDSLITHGHPDFPDVTGPRWRPEVHEVERWCALLAWAGIDCDPDDLRIARPQGPPDRSGVVVIHPGAAFAARRWPPDRFAAVARALRDEGHQVVVTGDGAEVALAETVADAAGLPPSSVLAGSLGLMEMVALVHDCRLLICGDTGVGHIATATGAPSVLLFGPTPPSRWGPRGTGPHVAVWAGDKGDPHADRPHSGLLLITVARVLDAAGNLLRECA